MIWFHSKQPSVLPQSRKGTKNGLPGMKMQPVWFWIEASRWTIVRVKSFGLGCVRWPCTLRDAIWKYVVMVFGGTVLTLKMFLFHSWLDEDCTRKNLFCCSIRSQDFLAWDEESTIQPSLLFLKMPQSSNWPLSKVKGTGLGGIQDGWTHLDINHRKLHACFD